MTMGTQDFSLGSQDQRVKDRGRRPRAVVRFLGRGSKPPLHQLGSLTSAVSSLSGVQGEPWPPGGFTAIFRTHDGLSRHCNFVNNSGLSSCSHWGPRPPVPLHTSL